MMNGNKEITFSSTQEQMAGRDFSEYRVLRVNPESKLIRQQEKFVGHHPIPDSGKLTVGGTPKGTTVHQKMNTQ